MPDAQSTPHTPQCRQKEVSQKTTGYCWRICLQSSSSAFSCVGFQGFFAFQEGMRDIQFSALPSSPTVSHRFMRRLYTKRHILKNRLIVLSRGYSEAKT